MSEPPMAERLELSSGTARAGVLLQGGELCSWLTGGRERLWSGDARWWPGHSPLLFPVVGHLREGQAWFGGSPRPMDCHGFASRARFTVQQARADRVRLVLISDEGTREAYPFDFSLQVDYHLTPDTLEIGLTVRNDGSLPMPYSIGLHPGFQLEPSDDPARSVAVVFGEAESPFVPVITPAGLFTRERRRLPLTGRRLPLTASLLAREALCFLDARSRSLVLEAPDGSAIAFEATGFDHWALWSRSGAPFVCVEAWSGHGDAHDFQGEFEARPSTRFLEPALTAHHALRLRWQAGAKAA